MMTRRILTAREQHEMLSPWRQGAPDPAHQERVRRMHDRDWAQRSLTPAQQRQQHAEGIDDSESRLEWDSRPKEGDEDYESGPEHLSQPTLPGMDGIQGESTRLWRGVPIDTSDPAFRKVWQMTYGQGEPVDDPGMFPDADLRYQDRGGEFDHPGLSDAILDGFESKGGVGEHHSTSFDVADEYGRGSAAGSDLRGKGPHLPVLLDSDWDGAGENLSRGGSGNVHQEKEIMLQRRKAPLNVVDLRVPGNAGEAENFGSWDDDEGWNSILDKPRNITARLAMAWDEWAPQIQHYAPGRPEGKGFYSVDHGNGITSDLSYTPNHKAKTLDIGLVGVNKRFQGDGIAEALIRRLHEDHPGYKINTGYMTPEGQGFHDHMLDKEPTARDIIAAATDPQGITGVNINDDYQDYTGQILRGEKTIETRDTPTLHHAVGQRIALVSTRKRPYRPALVVGYATIGSPVFYPDADAFDADYDRHLVDRDSPHHITSPTNKTGTKYGYPMLDVEDTEPFPAPRGGIVTRKNMQFGDQ